MKALRYVSVLVVLSFMIAACAPAATSTPAATTASSTSKLPDLGGRKVIVAVENAYPPFNNTDANGNGIGWDYDAFREICKRLNCVAEFKQAAWDGIFIAVAAGEYDVVADGVSITEERKQTVAFSNPYMNTIQVILVRADESRFTDSKSLAANTGLIVATQVGTTNYAKAVEIVGESRVRSYDTFDLAVLALKSGDADAVILDQEPAFGYLDANPGELKILDDKLKGDDLAFVFPQKSTLIDPVNQALAAMKADGTLDTLYAKWWPGR
jgi:polar amino acid transport system substrate-binding protein